MFTTCNLILEELTLQQVYLLKHLFTLLVLLNSRFYSLLSFFFTIRNR